MSKIFFTTCIVCCSILIQAQSTYFQQHVDYTIDVSLDDKSHILRGFETIKYTNNSPDTLQKVILHIWANAYKNDLSEYTKQDVENHETEFYFSKKDDKGFMDSLNFKVKNEPVNVSQYNNYEDIITLELNEPLIPSQTIEITTPFRLVIPLSFSRLGHAAQTYQISQWYPKPAVYDATGWHPMPYLNQGEFYSEFGAYTVRINVPKNYVVASTGNLEEESEKAFIRERIKKNDSLNNTQTENIDLSTARKTITFTQKNVHDFAWFADKDFMIEKNEVTLPSGKKVDCISYYKPENKLIYKNSTDIIASTIKYLSTHVGEYPYDHASIVDASLAAGDGMEYPMIAVIGRMSTADMLETVVIHEVGHNWFYGILGSNERDNPWMDESINSFYENEIKELTHQKEENTSIEKRVNAINDKLNGSFLYQLAAKKNLDQLISLPASDYTKNNYGGIVYQKGAIAFAYLKSYLGEPTFDKAMKRYYIEWKFKHPQPNDLKKIIIAESGQALDWFFDDLLYSHTKIDFAIKKISREGDKTKVYAKSKTSFKGPIPISASIGDSVIETQWISFPYETAAVFLIRNNSITSYRIDAYEEIPEIKISNNEYHAKSLFHRFQPAIKIGTGIGLTSKQTLYILPALGYNFYDKAMFGAALHNLQIPNHPFQFALATMYASGSKKMVGSAFVSYSFFPKRIFQEINLGLQGRTYHHDESSLNIASSIYLRHIKWMPFLQFNFKKKFARATVANSLYLRYANISNETFTYTFSPSDSLYRPSKGAKENIQLGSITFMHKNSRTFNPYNIKLNIDGNNHFVKTSVEANLQIDYFIKNKAFYARVFAGKFFDFNNSDNIFLLKNQQLNATYTARNDFMYDDTYLARNEQKGWQTQQISIREGGLKIATPLLTNPVGTNDNWLMSLNLRSDIPIKLPLKVQVFFDAATYANAGKLNNSGNKVIYDGGLECHLFSDLLIVYFPLMMSKDFKDYTKSMFPKNRLLNTMSFSAQLHQIKWFNTQKIISVF